MSEGNMSTESLDNILNGTSEEPAAEPAAEPKVEAIAEEAKNEEETSLSSPERLRDEHGRFLPKGEEPEPVEATEGATPAPEAEEPAHIPIAALKDERSKRQQAEDRARTLEAQLAQFQQPQFQPPRIPLPEAVPDRWEDPEGYDRWFAAQIKSEVLTEAQDAARSIYTEKRIEASAAQMSANTPDYYEKIEVYRQLANQTPGLTEQMMNHPDPAKFAYETAKMHVEMTAAGGMDAYIQAKANEIAEAKLAEAQSQTAAVVAKLPSAPPSIAAERNMGARSGPAWSGPTTLNDILSR